MTVLWWILGAIGILFAGFLVYNTYLAWVLRWEDEQTTGLAYYGLPPAGRAQFKERLRAHARRLAPILKLNAQSTKMDFARARIQYRGVSGPSGSCSVHSFEKGASYVPRPEDVFVVTQMKCGTTWMQHVVYEVLHRGRGDIVSTGKAMYALSPWLEGRKSVPMEQSLPLGAERPLRIIKTHFPASLCPYNLVAKYIYVARHPVSCFASCIDFIDTNVGGMAPELPAFVTWFTSPDLMWWGTWTDHVKGWWVRRNEPNVLFVYFEDMKKDLSSVVKRVVEFLGVRELTPDELSAVVHKCSFAYMQEHQDNFEMHPPHVLQTNAELFVAGTADRYKNVPAEIRSQVAGWVVSEMSSSDFPLEERYPDVSSEAERQKSA